MNQTLPSLKVALLGCGVVGSQVARLLSEQGDDLAVRVGARLELAGIAVRRGGHPRAPGNHPHPLPPDPDPAATPPAPHRPVEGLRRLDPARPPPAPAPESWHT